jgi:hypothetical protein
MEELQETLNVCTRRHFPKEDCRITAHLVPVFSVFEKTANFAVEQLTAVVREFDVI